MAADLPFQELATPTRHLRLSKLATPVHILYRQFLQPMVAVLFAENIQDKNSAFAKDCGQKSLERRGIHFEALAIKYQR
jgi:hypothetical protein